MHYCGHVTVADFDRRIGVPVADIKAKPQQDAGIVSQLLLGDELRILDSQGDFCLIKSLKDDYTGYVATTSLVMKQGGLTHYIRAPRTFLYPEADMKLPPLAALSLGSHVTIIDFIKVRGTCYGVLEDGTAIFAHHLAALDEMVMDYVSVAETLVHTPYLWGGASAFGIDCSALVQLCLARAGHKVLRDSHMQAATIGTILDQDAPLQRGDLVFWQGHVAIMCDDETLIHANGASMDVCHESYSQAVARIAPHYGKPIAYRRL